MSIKIQKIGIDLLSLYSEIPISFKVESVFRIEVINQGLGGFELIEEKVATYTKDYDSQEEDDKPGPIGWTKRFDVSKWGFFLALNGSCPVGGAAVAIDALDVNMLEGRKDLAMLWDIRVHPGERRHGIGSKLFKHASDWARQKGCKQLKVETPNLGGGFGRGGLGNVHTPLQLPPNPPPESVCQCACVSFLRQTRM